jgi:hypothetical protein
MVQFAGLNVGRMLARHLAPVKNATDGNTADDSKTLTHFRDSYTFCNGIGYQLLDERFVRGVN